MGGELQIGQGDNQVFIWREGMVWQEEAAKVIAATRELVGLGRVPNQWDLPIGGGCGDGCVEWDVLLLVDGV